jgi:protein involved in polysaccharide export with SLBB domain
MHSSSPVAMAPSHPANDLIREGDKITVRLSGVPDDGYFNEIQVPASGDITVPLLTQSFHAVGHSTSELAGEITEAYKAQKIYSNPVVTVLPEERYVNVGGEVRGPARVVYSADSTLMSTISSCGGFTEYADRRHVRILRGQQVMYVDAVAAAQNPGADPAVYPGDQIYVPRTIF